MQETKGGEIRSVKVLEEEWFGLARVDGNVFSAGSEFRLVNQFLTQSFPGKVLPFNENQILFLGPYMLEHFGFNLEL